MIPEERLSSEVVAAQFMYPRNIPRVDLVDYEYGGVDIQDASQGLRFQVWKGEYVGNVIYLSAPTVPAIPYLTIANVATFGFTFDQNMQPFICYELASGACRYRWFDPNVSGFVTSNLPDGSRSPRCCLDDNRGPQVPVSDILLSYCRSSSLYFRAQRERYQDEHLLTAQVGESRLLQMGMNKALRMQFLMSTTGAELEGSTT